MEDLEEICKRMKMLAKSRPEMKPAQRRRLLAAALELAQALAEAEGIDLYKKQDEVLYVERHGGRLNPAGQGHDITTAAGAEIDLKTSKLSARKRRSNCMVKLVVRAADEDAAAYAARAERHLVACGDVQFVATERGEEVDSVRLPAAFVGEYARRLLLAAAAKGGKLPVNINWGSEICTHCGVFHRLHWLQAVAGERDKSDARWREVLAHRVSSQCAGSAVRYVGGVDK